MEYPKPTEAELAAAASDMDRILEQEPELNDWGYRSWKLADNPAERQKRFQEGRKSICNPGSLADFIAARRWLRQFDKRTSLCRRGTSYGLKHVAEPDIGYVTNGVLIAAAIAEGFRAQRVRDTPNAFLNISARAWRDELRQAA